jgi:hypothetical protein
VENDGCTEKDVPRGDAMKVEDETPTFWASVVSDGSSTLSHTPAAVSSEPWGFPLSAPYPKRYEVLPGSVGQEGRANPPARVGLDSGTDDEQVKHV